MTWAIMLHGGASEIAPEDRSASRAGCRAALVAGRNVLERGGAALDAVEASVRVLEDDPAFNAGFGSVLNRDGAVEMDAAIMDGASLDLGGVAAIAGVRHPVSVARLMLRELPTLLVADGARRFARQRGAELCAPDAMIAPRRRSESGHDTVGCVALDRDGNLAVATSTGGLSGKLPGRVGDSPIPGCGLYADNSAGAVCFSGEGESIARTLLAARVMAALPAGDPEQVAAQSIEWLLRVGGEAGAIIISRDGRVGWAHNSPHFAVAYATSEAEGTNVYISKDEERMAVRNG